MLYYIRNTIGYYSHNNREQKKSLETFSGDFGKNFSTQFGKMSSAQPLSFFIINSDRGWSKTF